MYNFCISEPPEYQENQDQEVSSEEDLDNIS